MNNRQLQALVAKSSRYTKCIGEPRELYVYVYPTGKKSFFLRHNGRNHRLGEFRVGIYGVSEARAEATKLLYDLTHNIVRSTFGELVEQYLLIKSKSCSPKYVERMSNRLNRYLLPSLGNIQVDSITRSQLINLLFPLFNDKDPTTPRLETIHRLCYEMKAILQIAVDDGVIVGNPASTLIKEFPTLRKHYAKIGRDGRFASIYDEKKIYELIHTLRGSTRINLFTRNAIYLLMMSVVRPLNVVSAKWRDIQDNVWTIPASEMKSLREHKVYLSSQSVELLSQQKLYSTNEYVFSTPSGHICRDSLSKALRSLGFAGVVTPHGLRATFKTICSMHLSELYAIGVTEKEVECILAHNQPQGLAWHYERNMSQTDSLMKLYQWYSDYLWNICEMW